MDAHLFILSVFKVDRVMSHAENGEDEIDEGKDAVQPQETIPGGGEEGISECCDEPGIWTSLVLSVSPMATRHPVDHPKPAAEQPPKNERCSVQGVG